MKKRVRVVLFISVILFIFLFSCYTSVATGNVSFVADINPGLNSSLITGFKEYNGNLYFVANDGTHGRELWKYDGATATLVQDINPGSANAFISGDPVILTEYNGDLYFAANHITYGNELWKYNGITATLVQNFRPLNSSSTPGGLIVYKGELYFAADGGSGINRELHKYNGTNISLVEDHCPGDGFPTTPSLNIMVEYNDDLYFQCKSYEGGVYYDREFCKFNGTNVTMVKDIYYGATYSNPNGMVVYDGKLYFVAKGYDGVNISSIKGYELYQYDGISVTLAADINNGSGDSSPSYLTAYNGELYFRAYPGSAAGTGYELYKYNGTNATLVKDINPGAVHGMPAGLTIYNGELYFQANDGNNASAGNHGQELWKTDGTEAGTVIAADINPGINNSNPGPFYEYNGELYFQAENGTTGYELWKYSEQQCTPTNETCNNVDDDCDSLIDEDLTQPCGTGICAGTQTCTTGTWGTCSTTGQDAGTCATCNSTGNAIYDANQDIDCSPTNCPTDGCGLGSCSTNIFADYPINIPNECSTIYTCTTNTCNATCETDNDTDGYSISCEDCNDTNQLVNPGMNETCNDIDDNCDTQIDEGCPEWESIIYPEGIYEPNNTGLIGTHLHTFEIRFEKVNATAGQSIGCNIKTADGTIKQLTESIIQNITNTNVSVNYTVTTDDTTKIDKTKPWLIQDCGITEIKMNESNELLYTHQNDWAGFDTENDDAYRAMKCWASFPGWYFNNTEKCDYEGDVAFALSMSKGIKVEGNCHDGIDNDGNGQTDCNDRYCKGISYKCINHTIIQ